MGKHQHDQNAIELWEHYNAVIDWVKSIFKVPRKAMKGVDWGNLYNQYKNIPLDANEVELKIQRLIEDDDVQKQSGIYAYILTGDQKHLNLRTFPNDVKQRVYERQEAQCVICLNAFGISEMEADHVTPWSENGKNRRRELPDAVQGLQPTQV